MFERFTDRARKAMALANKSALEMGHDYIGTSHLLLGIVWVGSGVGANVLRELGIDLISIREEIRQQFERKEYKEAIIKRGLGAMINRWLNKRLPSEAKVKLPQTTLLKKALVYAIEEAHTFGHNYVGTEHELLGLLRVTEGIGAQVLMKLGVKLEQAREEVLRPGISHADKSKAFEYFTDRFRKVMVLAKQEAQRLNHEYIGTEHILLGLVKEGTGVGVNVLKNLEVDLEKMLSEVEKITKTLPDRETADNLPQTPSAKKVIEYTIEEARTLDHKYVGTEHLLLGLLLESEGVGGGVLRNLGLELEQVREEVKKLCR